MKRDVRVSGRAFNVTNGDAPREADVVWNDLVDIINEKNFMDNSIPKMKTVRRGSLSSPSYFFIFFRSHSFFFLFFFLSNSLSLFLSDSIRYHVCSVLHHRINFFLVVWSCSSKTSSHMESYESFSQTLLHDRHTGRLGYVKHPRLRTITNNLSII